MIRSRIRDMDSSTSSSQISLAAGDPRGGAPARAFTAIGPSNA
jgi:hypothetical protein